MSLTRTRAQTDPDPRTTRAQTDPENDSNPRTFKGLPRGKAQLAILQYLHEQQAATGVNKTQSLSRTAISRGTGIPKASIDNTIRRLVASGLLRRSELNFACNAGGVGYVVPRHVVNRLISEAKNLESVRTQTDPDPRTKQPTDPRTKEEIGGCSSRNLDLTTLTNPRARDDAATAAIEQQVARLGLDADDLRLGANDLVGVWRSWSEDADLGRFISSVEHAVFYARHSPDAKGEKGLKHPKAWLLKTLRQGYYPAPAGFISQEEQQAMAATEDARQRLMRLRAARKDAFLVEFEIWKLEKTPDELRRFLPEFGCSSPNSPAARVPLWEAFAAETGREDILPTVLTEGQFGTATA